MKVVHILVANVKAIFTVEWKNHNLGTETRQDFGRTQRAVLVAWCLHSVATKSIMQLLPPSHICFILQFTVSGLIISGETGENTGPLKLVPTPSLYKVAHWILPTPYWYLYPFPCEQYL